MSCDCGCCTGAHVATPELEANRPGLREIGHRAGTYTTFFETMRARLSSIDFPELAALRTRDAGDASIALCDAWSITADVLTFYQTRIANEGYLRTATERNSLLQLGRLTGYQLRPGVSASAYLAYTLDASAAPIDIPVGTRVQSVPAAGEKAQTFETAEPLSARADWSRITVRLTQPQWRAPPALKGQDAPKYYGPGHDVLEPKTGLMLEGTSTGLKPNDALLIDYGFTRQVRSGGAWNGKRVPAPVPYRVDRVTPDPDNQRTHVLLREWNAASAAAAFAGAGRPASSVPAAIREGKADTLATTVGELSIQLQAQPRNALAVTRDIRTTLRPGAQAYSRMLLAHRPALEETLVSALSTAKVTAATTPQPTRVYALRTQAALFGNGAPADVLMHVQNSGARSLTWYGPLGLKIAWGALIEQPVVPLDATYDQIMPSSNSGNPISFVLIDAPSLNDKSGLPRVLVVDKVDTVSMSIGSAITTRVSQLVVDSTWLPDISMSTPPSPLPWVHGDGKEWPDPTPDEIELLRSAKVLVQSEELTLAADPLLTDVAGGTDDEIELDRYYDGLTPGLWVIAAGLRADFTDPDVEVEAAERAMVSAVRHGLSPLVPLDEDGAPIANDATDLPGDTLHTFVRLEHPLTYRYRRTGFALYGNVVRATHGQTSRETLGSGDATQPSQQFALKSSPLTYVAAPTADGVDSTLEVRVNKLLWHETDDISGADANAHVYRTRRDDLETTRVLFGDGRHGARLPSGQDNITAVYRSGIGAAGNVRAGQLTVLADKPLGTSAVTNPIRASGGADRDTPELARVNMPLPMTALDRLVSVADYADFARTFAGIGKAASIKLPGPGGDFVQVTIAGIDDAPIDPGSDLFVDLVAALHAFGDPHLALRVDVREALSLVIEASIALQPDYAWDDVQPRIKSALLQRFGFVARELGQAVFGSEIIATIQRVAGVAHVIGGSVRLISDADSIAGLAPASGSADAPAASPAPWFTLTPTRGTTGGDAGWLAVDSARVDGNGGVKPAEIAYLPANIADCLILELAS
jgi:baseplate J-like protein